MRRRRAEKREVLGDLIYNDPNITMFINIIMREGKKRKAEKIVYDALEIVKERLKQDPLQAFYKALDNVRPQVEVRPRRIGGATYQIPIAVPRPRGISIALRWIRDIARIKKGRPMYMKLAEEIINAYKGEGAAIKKRDDTHRMAEANKAFAHFRW